MGAAYHYLHNFADQHFHNKFKTIPWVLPFMGALYLHQLVGQFNDQHLFHGFFGQSWQNEINATK